MQKTPKSNLQHSNQGHTYNSRAIWDIHGLEKILFVWYGLFQNETVAFVGMEV